jgi:hypothetical protein
MFPHTDARTMLDLHNQHADDLRREAAAYRLSRDTGRHRRFGRHTRRGRPAPTPGLS